MKTKEYSVDFGGKTMTAQFTDLADQASGSVILKCDDTVVFASACMSKDGSKNPGFFNLTVEYMEKFYASGLILGGQYSRREGRPSDEAIISARVIDRTIRPLFAHHIKNAVQVIIMVLSVGKSDPGVLAINAASLALATSDIPWDGPVGAVHVGKVKGSTDAIKVDEYILNTGESPYELDFTICGRGGNVCMIEAMAYEYPEEVIDSAIDLAMPEIARIEAWQKQIVSEIGKEKLVMPKPELPEEVKQKFAETIGPKLAKDLWGADSKHYIYEYEDEWKKIVAESWAENKEIIPVAEDYYQERVDALMHEGALVSNKRVDGRAMDKVRALVAEVGTISPMLHGTGIFYRGETHVLSVVTLAGPESAYKIDGMEIRGTKRFMHHYNFPPFSAGETGRVGGLNRREMGHGMLAEKALYPVIPAKETFPYTIRIVSESMASNGSTSQASICASSLALMDGGVPITRPVAGIAMGLILDQNANSKNQNGIPEYRILTDIQGPEDHHGDMDFKVGGTSVGVTAIQLDIKVLGVPPAILKEALREAKIARMTILAAITEALPAPRAEISKYAPKIVSTKIKVDQIGLVIGSGGKTIKAIKEKTGAEITVEDDGMVYVTGKDGSADAALKLILELTHEYKVGEKMEGEVVKILEIGAIVKISEAKDGLVHISEIAPFRVNKVTDFLREGMKVPVEVVAVDPERDRISLSIKKADPDFIKSK